MNIPHPRTRHLLPSGLCGLLLYACATAAMATPLPPLLATATDERHVGKVIWADLVTPDMAGAERFYSGLFGWTFLDTDADYAVASLDGRPVAGLVHRAVPPGEHRQPAWLTFISVRDLDAASQNALAHGGKVVFATQSVPHRGRQAVFADPDGAVFAVLASSSGDPPDVLAAPGEWIWSSLLVRNADAEAAFYQTLFGYEVFELPSDHGVDHLILSSDAYARASLNSLPGDVTHRHPHWINFVRVVDTTEAAARAVALGGRVLVEPRPDRHGGSLAVIADPSGAPIGLMEWAETDSKQEPK